jgi:voltage-gated potassium channel
MKQADSKDSVRRDRWRLFRRKQLLTLWPQGPLAAVLVLAGTLNIVDGLKLPITVIERIHELEGMAEPLSALGGTMQAILGFLFVVAGIGLLWRLASAWTLSVLLLVVMLGIHILRPKLGVSISIQVLLLGALFFFRRRFTRRTVFASFVLSLSSILAVMLYGVFGSYLLGKGFDPPILDFQTATYFAITTLSTVGFGDIVPKTPEARWFVVSLLVAGLGVFASAIATVLGPKLSSELTRLFNPREKIMDLKNHVILVGEGSIARNTARELSQRGIAFVQIFAADPPQEHTVEHALTGDATSETVLRQAGIERARMVIAAREDDGDNAFIALGAKDLNPDVHVLAVASSAQSIRRLKLARADLVFSPAAVGSRLMADLVEGNQIEQVYQDLLEGHLKKA